MIKFIPASKRDIILSTRIVSIEVVAHERLPNGGNHWAFYLHSTPTPTTTTNNNDNNNNFHTTQLDVSPSYSIPSSNPTLPGGSKAFLILSSYDHPHSTGHSATKKVQLTVRQQPPVTISEVVDLLTVRNRRHCYEFDNLGRGCRFWIRDQIPLLLEAGVIVDGVQAEEALAAILLEFPGKEEFPMAVGEYY